MNDQTTTRRILQACMVSHFTIHIFELSLPAVLILVQEDLGVGDFTMGQVITTAAVLFGLGSLPAGWLSDRIGSRLLLIGCQLGGALGMLLLAWAQSVTGLFVGAIVMGLSISIYHPAGTALLSHGPQAKTRLFAWHGMAGNIGVAGSAFAAGGLAWLVGWRLALTLLAGLAFVAIALLLRVKVPSQQELTRSGQTKGSWGLFVALLVCAGLLGMVYRGLTTFLPKYFHLNYHSGFLGLESTGRDGALATMALVVGIAGMYVSGRIAERMRSELWYLIAIVVQIPLFWLLASMSDAPLLLVAMGVAFFHFATQPVGNYLVSVFTPARLRGMGYGIYFLVLFGLGAPAGAMAGYISETRGLPQVFPLLGLLLIPAAIITIGMLRKAIEIDRDGETPSAPDTAQAPAAR